MFRESGLVSWFRNILYLYVGEKEGDVSIILVYNKVMRMVVLEMRFIRRFVLFV